MELQNNICSSCHIERSSDDATTREMIELVGTVGVGGFEISQLGAMPYLGGSQV